MKRLLLTCFLLLAMSRSFSVPLTLWNTGLKPIYLEIPGVMNPNLSPFSKSGVDLQIGQKIFFFYKDSRYILIEVTEELSGQKIDVKKLIRKRKKEIRGNE